MNSSTNIPGQAVLPELVETFRYDTIGNLTSQQEKFCREYVLRGNNLLAAYRAAYTKSKPVSANANAWRLLRAEHIQKRIAEIKEEMQRKFHVDASRIVGLLSMTAFMDRRQFVDETGKPLDFHMLDSEAASAPATSIWWMDAATR